MFKIGVFTIGMAYGAVMKWIEENGYEVSGLPRESYIDGIWNKEDPEEWITEVQIPVRLKNYNGCSEVRLLKMTDL